nr:ABC transporter substrate-binding protein [Candidatus Sigynarchaeota archaeon]
MKFSATKGAALLAMVAVAGIVVAFGTWFVIDSQKLRVGYVQYDLNHLSVHYARSEGLFRNAGLDLKFIAYTNELAIMDALAADQLDIAFVGLAPAIKYNRTNWLPITALASVSVNGSGLIVNKNANITMISELENKTIAIPAAGGTQDFLLRIIVNGTLEYGLNGLTNTTDDINVTAMNVIGMPWFMNSSINNAYLAPEVCAAKGVFKTTYGDLGYSGKYLVKSGDAWHNHPSSVIVARSALFAQPAYVDAIRRFLGVHVQATDAINAMAINATLNATIYGI